MILKTLLSYIFGSFNGIQVFLFPGLMLYWLESDRLVSVVSDLLGLNIHYFPLGVFILVGMYVAFIMVKHLFLNAGQRGKAGLDVGGFAVDLHRKLLIVLICFALLFILAAFFKYFYGIRIPVKAIAAWAARVLGIGIILYYYLTRLWLGPWLDRGHSRSGSEMRARAYAGMHPWGFTGFNLFQIVMIFVMSRIYVNLLEYIYHPLFSLLGSATGIRLELRLLPLTSNLTLIADLALAGAAFLISNLLFIPLVWMAGLLSAFMHPIRPTLPTPDRNPTLRSTQDQEDHN